jgi:hypothetical protein
MTPPQQPQGQVSFHPSVVVRIVQRVYELGATEPLWYTIHDFHTFEMDARHEWQEEKKKAALRMMNSSPAPGRRIPKKLVVPSHLRGLELDDDDEEMYNESRHRTLVEATSLVLEWQSCQRREGIRNPELIASLYTRQCRKSQEVALLTGMKDERWVQKEQKRQQQVLELEDSRRQQRTSASTRTSRSSWSSTTSSSSSTTTTTTTTSSGTRPDYRKQRERYLRAKLGPKARLAPSSRTRSQQ